MMQAVILAAGRGSRLQDASDGGPKCLIRIGRRSLIEHQFQVLNDAGIERICVVAGHRLDHVRAAVGRRCDIVVNPRFSDTNSLYSLWLTRHWVRGPFLLMNCDLLAHPDVYHRVLAVNGSALAFDGTSGHDEEHMKVTIRQGRVRALGKDLPLERTHGENVGILRFDTEAARALFDDAGAIVDAGGERSWAPAAVSRLAQRFRVRAIDVADLPWTEIDFPDDLRSARRDIWPLIETGCWQAAALRASGRTPQDALLDPDP